MIIVTETDNRDRGLGSTPYRTHNIPDLEHIIYHLEHIIYQIFVEPRYLCTGLNCSGFSCLNPTSPTVRLIFDRMLTSQFT